MLQRSPLNPTQFLLPPCVRQNYTALSTAHLLGCTWVSAYTFVHTSFCLCTWVASAKLCSSIPSVTQAPYASWCSRYFKWFLRKLCSIVESKLCVSKAGEWTFLRQWNFLASAWRWGVFWQELTPLLPMPFGVFMAKETAGQCRRVSCKCYLPHSTIL